MQWFVVILFLLPAALGIPAVLGYSWVDHQLHQPANPGTSNVRFVIPPGANFHEVADTLHRTGLIDSVTVFDFYARYKHLDRNVQAGAYELSRNLNMIQILRAVTIPRSPSRGNSTTTSSRTCHPARPWKAFSSLIPTWCHVPAPPRT